MYLDSAIIVKLLVKEPDSEFFAEQVDGQANVWSSELAITECWSALCRKEHENVIAGKMKRDAWLIFESYVSNGSLHLQPITPAILRQANLVIEVCRRTVALRTLDAIHLATCEFCGAHPLVTTDTIMRKSAEQLGIPLLEHC